jgi:hypothetical protein
VRNLTSGAAWMTTGFMSRMGRVETPCVKGGTHPKIRHFKAWQSFKVAESGRRDDQSRHFQCIETLAQPVNRSTGGQGSNGRKAASPKVA